MACRMTACVYSFSLLLVMLLLVYSKCHCLNYWNCTTLFENVLWMDFDPYAYMCVCVCVACLSCVHVNSSAYCCIMPWSIYAHRNSVELAFVWHFFLVCHCKWLFIYWQHWGCCLFMSVLTTANTGCVNFSRAFQPNLSHALALCLKSFKAPKMTMTAHNTLFLGCMHKRKRNSMWELFTILVLNVVCDRQYNRMVLTAIRMDLPARCNRFRAQRDCKYISNWLKNFSRLLFDIPKAKWFTWNILCHSNTWKLAARMEIEKRQR